MIREPDQLLRAEFPRECLRATDNPLQFVVHELGAMVERMPRDLAVQVNTASKIVVTITTE